MEDLGVSKELEKLIHRIRFKLGIDKKVFIHPADLLAMAEKCPALLQGSRNDKNKLDYDRCQRIVQGDEWKRQHEKKPLDANDRVGRIKELIQSCHKIKSLPLEQWELRDKLRKQCKDFITMVEDAEKSYYLKPAMARDVFFRGTTCVDAKKGIIECGGNMTVPEFIKAEDACKGNFDRQTATCLPVDHELARNRKACADADGFFQEGPGNCIQRAYELDEFQNKTCHSGSGGIIKCSGGRAAASYHEEKRSCEAFFVRDTGKCVRAAKNLPEFEDRPCFKKGIQVPCGGGLDVFEYLKRRRVCRGKWIQDEAKCTGSDWQAWHGGGLAAKDFARDLENCDKDKARCSAWVKAFEELEGRGTMTCKPAGRMMECGPETSDVEFDRANHLQDQAAKAKKVEECRQGKQGPECAKLLGKEPAAPAPAKTKKPTKPNTLKSACEVHPGAVWFDYDDNRCLFKASDFPEFRGKDCSGNDPCGGKQRTARLLRGKACLPPCPVGFGRRQVPYRGQRRT